jgi:hypothetical protein
MVRERGREKERRFFWFGFLGIWIDETRREGRERESSLVGNLVYLLTVGV